MWRNCVCPDKSRNFMSHTRPCGLSANWTRRRWHPTTSFQISLIWLWVTRGYGFQTGIEPWSLGSNVNTLTTRPLAHGHNGGYKWHLTLQNFYEYNKLFLRIIIDKRQKITPNSINFDTKRLQSTGFLI